MLKATEERRRCLERPELQTPVGGIGLQGLDVSWRGPAIDGPLIASEPGERLLEALAHRLRPGLAQGPLVNGCRRGRLGKPTRKPRRT